MTPHDLAMALHCQAVLDAAAARVAEYEKQKEEEKRNVG
jgi:hypothetical protein